jgi:hypothetical protein
VGADEHHPRRGAELRRGQACEGLWNQPKVGAALIALGAATGDHARVLEHLEVMGDEVRRQVEGTAKLTGRRVARQQGVYNGQTGRFAECGMHPRPPIQRELLNIHRLNGR